MQSIKLDPKPTEVLSTHETANKPITKEVTEKTKKDSPVRPKRKQSSESKISGSVDQDGSGRVMGRDTDATSLECLRQQVQRIPEQDAGSLMSSLDTSSWPIQVSGLSSVGAQIECHPLNDSLLIHSAGLRHQQEELCPVSTISDSGRFSLEL